MSNNDVVTTMKIGDLSLYGIIFETSCHTIRYAADKTGHKFAVKQTSQNSLCDEYDMMEKINCPYIMKAKGFEKKDGMNYLIMNLAEKEDLFISLCETGPKTEDVTRNIMFSIFTAVNYLHANNIWHRDITLENVFIFTDGLRDRYVLGDLEFAREFNIQWMNTEYIGSEDYQAPELLMKQRCMSNKINYYSYSNFRVNQQKIQILLNKPIKKWINLYDHTKSLNMNNYIFF